ncbi:MAG TPA: DNA polymerase, partial [Caldisericia bacterium]|nr:DNA polymerase [Caldisericia bacterium]HQO99759.1 DNA polymerase [Caldisericia bacterium]
TTGLNFDDEVVGISLAWGIRKEESVYLPIKHKVGKNYSLEDIKALLSNPLISENVIKVFHNFYFDYLQLKKLGLEVNEWYEDTKLIAYLLDPEQDTSLSAQSKKYNLKNQKEKNELKNLIKVKNRLTTFDTVSIDEADEYSSKDARATLELFSFVNFELKKNSVLYDWYECIELPLEKVLAEMTWNGINLDTALLQELHLNFEKQLNQLEKEIHLLAKEEFNVNSSKQLQRILYRVLGLPKIKMTDKGQLSTDNESLQALESYHPIIPKLLRYRKIKKLYSTYTTTLVDKLSKHDNRLHTTFSQMVTATGRLASSNPNLQNIPKKDEEGRKIREAFVAKKGHKFIIADYKQIELMVAAFLSGENKLYNAFKNGEDVHQMTANSLFANEKDKVVARLNAKKVNFGVLYGMGAGGLSKVLNCHPRTAKKVLDDYFKTYPMLKLYAEQTALEAETFGYVKTISGRIRYIRDINSTNEKNRKHAERIAINTPVQGSAADIIKIAMVQLQKEIDRNKLDAKILIQVHDELIVEVKNSEVKKMKDIIEKSMTKFYLWDIPKKLEDILAVSIDINDRWVKD